jgi:UDP-N-acetylmuramoyl-tripeptide--D-alanyl-D-alanine ligase
MGAEGSRPTTATGAVRAGVLAHYRGAVKFTASEIATATGGTLVGRDVDVEGASIDSRDVASGQLFVALVGDRDGHEFVPHAVAAGAGAVLTDRPLDVDVPRIEVDDTAVALTALGAHARERLPGRVVGITGSVGKTSTKDLAAAALSRRLLVAASEKSFNNELGVPLTLANAADRTEVAVIEMGARGPGHIAALCAVARPTIAVVTAVALVHAEVMGGLDEIARAKAELPASLPADGVAVLNAADERVLAMADVTVARVVRYGTDTAEVRAGNVEIDDELRPSFLLETEWGSSEVRLSVRGLHQVGNALAAAAVALVCEVPVEEVAAGLGEGVLSPWRMELATAPSGARVLNDAYNAGPASMAAALRSLAQLAADRRVAVLGPMAELGPEGPAEHRRIAALAEELGVRLVAYRTDDYGVASVDGVDEAMAAVGSVRTGDAVLVKGSRVAGLEQVAEALLV